jgi:hypothetical protein
MKHQLINHHLVSLAACCSPGRAHRADWELTHVCAGKYTAGTYPAQGAVGGGPGRRGARAYMQWHTGQEVAALSKAPTHWRQRPGTCDTSSGPASWPRQGGAAAGAAVPVPVLVPVRQHPGGWCCGSAVRFHRQRRVEWEQIGDVGCAANLLTPAPASAVHQGSHLAPCMQGAPRCAAAQCSATPNDRPHHRCL